MACCFGFPGRGDIAGNGSKGAGTLAENATVKAVMAGQVRSSLLSHVLPNCEPVRVLGEGTFGTIVHLRDRATGANIAAKIMSKAQLLEEDQWTNAITERRVLRKAGPHPFVIFCHAGFQTDDAVVLVLEYLSGGDMYDLLKKHGCLTEDQARFYIAEILSGLQELHRHNFVFRDLKLENILIDDRGHIRLTDFGLAGSVESTAWDDRTITDLSGTAIYQAPEILAGRGHGQLVDFWALGVLTHVILTGRPPFAHEDRKELYRQIQSRDLDLEADKHLVRVSEHARDFIAALLQRDPSKRLGADADEGLNRVRAHPFFHGIDWDALLRFEIEPPLPPPVRTSTHTVSDMAHDDSDSSSAGARSMSGAADVERSVRDKLARGNSAKRRPFRTKSMQSQHLDSTEFKIVHVAPSS